MLEIQMLRMLTKRVDYQKIKGAIPHSGLTELTKRVADRFGEYFKQFPEVQEITPDEFLLWYFGTVQTKADEETRSEWHAVMQRVAEPVADETKDTMFNRLIELQAASEIADIVMRYEEGRDVDVLAEIQESLKEAASNRKTSLETDIIEDDVLDMMDAEEAGIGFTFHTIPIIDSYVKPVPPKNLIGIAARPDAGKTTLTGQVAFSFAKDLEKVLGPGRQVTWFCNEGDPRKIVYRMYSVALGMSVTEMRAFRETVCKGNNNLFLEKVWEAWGQEHIFKVINANNKTTSWVEDTVAKLNSGIIVYDMLDNVIFSGKTMHSGTRTDQVLESMYQWGRSLAVETNSVAIATSQTSGDAEGIPFPAKSQLKDSKTGKQGTFDLLLMMGESSDPSMEKYRYLGTPKNKFARDDRPKNMQVTTIFDHTRGSFSAVGAAPKEIVDSSNRKVVKALEAQDETVNTESQGDEPVAKPSRKSRKQAPIELKD